MHDVMGPRLALGRVCRARKTQQSTGWREGAHSCGGSVAFLRGSPCSSMSCWAESCTLLLHSNPVACIVSPRTQVSLQKAPELALRLGWSEGWKRHVARSGPTPHVLTSFCRRAASFGSSTSVDVVAAVPNSLRIMLAWGCMHFVLNAHPLLPS